MSIKGEEWNENDYVMRGFKLTRPMVANNQARTSNLPFDMVDYNANRGIPCYIYEKTLLACFNNFGLYSREFLENKDCCDANQWFGHCTNNNAAMSQAKKYCPEDFVTNRSSSPILDINDVLL